MELPTAIWNQPEKRGLIEDFVAALDGHPVVLTDQLANSTWLSPEAERIFGDRAEALVNRVAFSLLGFGERDKLPPGLREALIGEGPAWRGAVRPAGHAAAIFVEASCIRQGTGFVSGVIRFSEEDAR